MVLLLIFYCLIPAAVIWLCRKVTFLNKIGPILLLYIIGIVVGNLPVMPTNAFQLQDILTSVIIPIAIPMLLFNSDFRKFSVRKSFLALLCGVIAVVATVIIGYFIFKPGLGNEGYKVGGMLTGVYTGGTPNLAALKLVLGVKDETYILLNTYDMLISFLYLVFLMTVGIRMFRKLLPATRSKEAYGTSSDVSEYSSATESNPYKGIFTGKSLRQIFSALGLSVAIFAASAAIAALSSGRLSEGFGAVMSWKYFMAILILSLTTLGILASFIPKVRSLEKSYDAGMYLVYIFSVVVASMADLSNLNLRGGLYMLLYIAFVIFVSLAIQTILARIFRIDGDTMVISSVSLINSPPMVPMIAAAMKNRDVIITGLSVGIIGYAIGNYLGFAIAELLSIL